MATPMKGHSQQRQLDHLGNEQCHKEQDPKELHFQLQNRRKQEPNVDGGHAGALCGHMSQMAVFDDREAPLPVLPVRVKGRLQPDLNIICLDGMTVKALEEELDIAERWRRLCLAADNTEFFLHQYDVEKIASSLSSFTRQLLLTFGSRGMNVQTLLELLVRAQLEAAQEVLREPEPLRIISHPKATVELREGDTLTLTCQGQGFPRPQYQWYFYDDQMYKLPYFVGSTLVIHDIRMSQAGHYVCKVHNCAAGDFPESNWSNVIVKKANMTADLRIIRQNLPSHLTVCQMESVQIECHAVGVPQPMYQWYKNDIPLIGHQNPILKILMTDASDSGEYYCVINNGQIIRSDAVFISAQAKVALLIGTETYHTSHPKLPAARHDVLLLESHLKKMNFMVVTLLNLNKAEILEHTKWFAELLDEGVYGLFFYIGHGFECHGESFLIPWDAPINFKLKHCVHLRKEVLKPLLDRHPTLCLAMIDICRAPFLYIEKDDIPETVKLDHRGNTCIFFATSPGQSSYENRDTGKGIFMTHLSKVIHENVTVQVLHDKILNEIKCDPDAGHQQYPMIESNLNVPCSLHDPIFYHGHTEAFNLRRLRWERAQTLPDSRKLTFPEYGLTLQVRFEKEFCNVMRMVVMATDMGSVTAYLLQLNNVPPEISGSQDKPKLIRRSNEESRFWFHDLQRVQDVLIPVLRITVLVYEQRKTIERVLDLEQPLVSALHLNRPSKLFDDMATGTEDKVAIQQEESCHSSEKHHGE